jgi:pyrroloquinoline-quinone synthase
VTPLSADALERELRGVLEERYHGQHPFHRLLHEGALSRGQLQAWVLNRFHYQSIIPRKDAALIARMTDPELRRAWRVRLEDHDGAEGREGGLARWLALAEAVGLDRGTVASTRLVLPAVRFAGEAYLHLCAERPLLEGIAASLTELFAPALIAERISAMLRHYPFIDAAALRYFEARLEQAPRDAGLALGHVRREATTVERQRAVVDALRAKCDVLWAILDALHHAYVSPGLPPPGAFRWAG